MQLILYLPHTDIIQAGPDTWRWMWYEKMRGFDIFPLSFRSWALSAAKSEREILEYGQHRKEEGFESQ